MARPDDGEPASRNRLHAALRGSGMAAAVGLGAFAIWLIVTAETQKGTRVGALIGFWALLLAAFAVFGTRHPLPALAPPGQDLEIRPGSELTRVEDVAARREYEYRLTEMLRREIQATMSAELVTLRADVSALRSELVEKVGGQLRLERIETTRVIGSDIEALQHEVRQMMGGRQPAAQVGSFSLGSTHTSLLSSTEQPSVVEPTDRGVPYSPAASEPLVPEPVGPTPFPPEPAAPKPFEPEPLPPEPLAPEPLAPEPLAPEPLAPEPLAPEPFAPRVERPEQAVPLPWLAEPSASGDPFASMPRLRPFTDVDLDPVETEPENDPDSDPDNDPYAGRRRHDGAVSPVNRSSEPAAPRGGRHTKANGEAHGAHTAGTGGRRRRAVDGDDVLARILNREGAR